MTGWLLAAGMASILAAAVPGFVWGFAQVMWPGWIAEPSIPFYVLIAALGFQTALTAAAIRQGRRGAGLGLAPVRRVRLIVGLCVATAGWLAVLIGLASVFPALEQVMKAAASDLLSGKGVSGFAMWLLRATVLAVMAPLSEELFFRGWLWEASRARGHGTMATMLLTGAPWLLLHGVDAPVRILFLLPTAAILTFARHAGGTVRASLLVHAVNNGAVVALQTIAILAREAA